MLRYGIPAFRLPPELLEQELEQIRVLGIPIHTGAKVDRLVDFRKPYDAVFVGPGTQTSRQLPIPGAHLPFVHGGVEFLRAVRSGETVRVGPRVVVIGGGNVAIDVALTALRQGAKHVDMVYRQSRRKMTASPHEIEIASPDTPLHEIASLLESNSIKRVPIVKDNQVVGIVSRANLIQAVAREWKELEIPVSDEVIRDKILENLKAEPWAHTGLVNVIVKGGVVDLFGITGSEAERKAIRVAAESVPGVCAVHDNFIKQPIQAWA